jgi:hypothetical protein
MNTKYSWTNYSTWTVREHPTDGPLGTVLMVKFRQPGHEFTIGVGMTFVSYPLVLTPVV